MVPRFIAQGLPSSRGCMLSFARMPVVAAPLFGFALGIAFAWAGTEELARLDGSPASRSLVIAGLFGVLVYAPACGYFTAFFPDWSYAYLVDAERRSAAL